MIEELAVIDAKPIKAKRIEREPMTAEESNEWVVRIKAEMDKGTELETGAMEAYRRAGAMLIQVRGRLGPRKFKPWVEQNFDKSVRVAYRCIKVASVTPASQIEPAEVHGHTAPKANGQAKATASDDATAGVNKALAAEMLRTGYGLLADGAGNDDDAIAELIAARDWALNKLGVGEEALAA